MGPKLLDSLAEKAVHERALGEVGVSGVYRLFHQRLKHAFDFVPNRFNLGKLPFWVKVKETVVRLSLPLIAARWTLRSLVKGLALERLEAEHHAIEATNCGVRAWEAERDYLLFLLGEMHRKNLLEALILQEKRKRLIGASEAGYAIGLTETVASTYAKYIKAEREFGEKRLAVLRKET